MKIKAKAKGNKAATCFLHAVAFPTENGAERYKSYIIYIVRFDPVYVTVEKRKEETARLLLIGLSLRVV